MFNLTEFSLLLQSAYQRLLSVDQIFTQIFLIVLFSLFLVYLSERLLQRLHFKLAQTKSVWDDLLVLALRRPLRWLILLYGIVFVLQVFEFNANVNYIFKVVAPLQSLATIVICCWFLINLTGLIEKRLLDETVNQHSVDVTTVQVASKLIRAVLVISTMLVGLQSVGIPVSGVLAFGGIGGIAVGYAAKDLLANFFGALMLYFDRPFVIGDWVCSPDRSIEGTVEAIGWRCCRIRTFDKRVLYVPNAVFTTISVENPSRMTNRRIKTTIGLRYQDIDVMPAILSAIKSVLQQHPEIDTTKTLLVNFVDFGESSLDFIIYTFTKTTDWAKFLDIQQEVFFKVAAIIAEYGAEIAFPTQKLHMG